MNFFGRVCSPTLACSRVSASRSTRYSRSGRNEFVDPPLAPLSLQHLDVILITHAHMDHLDIPSLNALPKSAVVVACAKCSQIIAPLGFKDVRELKWGEKTS